MSALQQVRGPLGSPLGRASRLSIPSRSAKSARRLTSSQASELRAALTSRRLPVIFDYLSPTPSHLLDISLLPFLYPRLATQTASLPFLLPSTRSANVLPAGHHLVYFPAQVPSNALLPDGTDPLHSPGPPYTRRLWAGGRVSFHPSRQRQLRLDGSRVACVERIRDVVVKDGGWDANDEPGKTVFVRIERRIGVSEEGESDADTRLRLNGDGDNRDDDIFGDTSAAIVERRDLAFLHEARRRPLATEPRILRPHRAPTFSQSMTPTPGLLFRFSALTFNAHLIHLDPEYCRRVESQPTTLVHGPLSLTLLLSLLSSSRLHGDSGGGAGRRVLDLEYRNLAPLYAGDELTVCGRATGEGAKGKADDRMTGEGDKGEKSGTGEATSPPGQNAASSVPPRKAFEVWIQDARGGYAVKGSAITEETE